ncbi:MAG: metallophosphoesterase [Candidatus Aminicenantales bacterium]
MAHKRNLLFSISVGLLLLACSALYPAALIPFEWTGVEKIIAIGDLHGDYDNFVLILKNPKVALVDDDLHWTGGKTHLVQTGDVMDRGDQAKEIFDLLMRLEKEAEATGGKVHVLLGNHEEATITGISLGYPEYVSVKQFVSFLPENFRKSKEKEYVAGLPADEKAQAQALGGDLDKNPGLLNFWAGILSNVRKRNNPLAALAYVENFNRTYGKWLLQKNCIIKINDIIFAHGGINLEFSKWKLKDINEVLRMELWAYILRPTKPLLGGQPFTPKLVYNPQSPLWYRQDDTASQPEIDEILTNLGAGRMVVGHNFLGSGGGSPIVLQEDAVARFEGKVWMIDTGIGYTDVGGVLYALIIEDGKFNFYSGSADATAQSPEASPTNEGPKTTDEIEKFLRTSTPQLVVPGAAGRTEPWRVKLEAGGIIRWAQFKYINRPRPEPIPDSFKYEIAAYVLDKHLGLDLVPPAVPRTINDTSGSLQMFIENAMRESDRKRENITPPDPEAFNQAMADLKVFENLVYDSCKNDKDTLIQREMGKVYRVDFSEAFAPENGTVPGCEILSCSRRLYQRLCDWEREKVTTLLAPYLNEEEIRALHARQGSIVRMIQEQIEKQGESDVLF